MDEIVCIFLLGFCLHFQGFCQTHNTEKPFVSNWYSVSVNGSSPLVIQHTLNELPAKVDVQVKVLHGGREYIFQGLGSTPKDDDINNEYGGVAYAYNSSHIFLFFPVYKSYGRGIGRVITTGGLSYNGPFVGSFISGRVRVRAWKLSNWSKPDFVLSSELTISKVLPYRKVHHCLGTYPDFVTVQLLLPNGLISEGLGTTSITDHHAGNYGVCGTVFAIDDTSITLWAATGSVSYVGCYRDGWGENIDIKAESADVIIRAWIISSTVVSNFEYVKGNVLPGSGEIPFSKPIDLDLHLVNVEVRDVTLSRGNVFYGAGSANLGKAGDSFGGVLFGYTQSEVLLWTPSPSVSGSNLIYIGGLWGDGTDNMKINNVNISIKVIMPGSSECSVPPDIPNAIKMYNGVTSGSRALYSCSNGFSSNGGMTEIRCNGTRWSEATLICSKSQTCGNPSALLHGYVVWNDYIAVYFCNQGYFLNGTNDTSLCEGNNWTSPSIQCIRQPVVNHTDCNTSNYNPEDLRIPKKNISAYQRSLTCSRDQRLSSKVMGLTGAVIICSYAVIFILSDCDTFCRKRNIKVEANK